MGAVDLHRPRAEPELPRDRLVRSAAQQPLEDLALAARERRDARPHELRRVVALGSLERAGERRRDRRQHRVVVVRRLEPVDRAGLHRLHGGADAAPALAHGDHRQADPARLELAHD